MSWITVDQSRFRLTRGEPKQYPSSDSARREFCGRCGSHLTFRHCDNQQTIDIAIGTLDIPEAFAPDNQIWGSERLPFLSEINDLPTSVGDAETANSGSSGPVDCASKICSADVEIRDTTDISRDDILRLYEANGWSSAKKPEQLYRGLLNSSMLVTAWIDNRLVGLANAITDGHLVVYYPHMLVDPAYQGIGIGHLIVGTLQVRYAHMHQQVLVAYGSAVEFYRKCGFDSADESTPMWIYSAS